MHPYIVKTRTLSGLLFAFLILVSCNSQVRSTISPDVNKTGKVTVETTEPPPTLTSSPVATSTPAVPTDTPPPSSTPTPQPSATPEDTPTPTGYPQEISDNSGAAMLLVPAGKFEMGSKGLSKIEEPIHTVYLDDFYIDKYEVSNEQYAQFLNEEGNQFEGLANWIEANDPDLRVHEVEGEWIVEPGYENYPMNEMTWYGARAFCEWRGARLPTEAEWEKAARGTDGRLFPWGEKATCENANYYGCNYDLVPVDSYPESISPYGAYNMAGNIMEWVNDWYGDGYYASSPEVNPQGPDSGTHKIFRGGSYINGAHHIRTTYRWPKLPVLTYVATGFRCAKDANP